MNHELAAQIMMLQIMIRHSTCKEAIECYQKLIDMHTEDIKNSQN